MALSSNSLLAELFPFPFLWHSAVSRPTLLGNAYGFLGCDLIDKPYYFLPLLR